MNAPARSSAVCAWRCRVVRVVRLQPDPPSAHRRRRRSDGAGRRRVSRRSARRATATAAREAERRRWSTTAACVRRPPAEIENIIRNGMPNGMPPFGSLPEADLQAVTAFVRSFNSSAFDLQPAGRRCRRRGVLLRKRAVLRPATSPAARSRRRSGPVEHRAADDGP